MAIRFWPKIQEALNVLGREYTDLARQAGVNHQMVLKWKQRDEADQDAPQLVDLEQLVKVAHAAGLTMDELLGTRPVAQLTPAKKPTRLQQSVMDAMRETPEIIPVIESLIHAIAKARSSIGMVSRRPQDSN